MFKCPEMGDQLAAAIEEHFYIKAVQVIKFNIKMVVRPIGQKGAFQDRLRLFVVPKSIKISRAHHTTWLTQKRKINPVCLTSRVYSSLYNGGIPSQESEDQGNNR